MRESLESLQRARRPTSLRSRRTARLWWSQSPARASAGEGRNSARGSESAAAARLTPGPLLASGLEFLVGVIFGKVIVILDSRLGAIEYCLPPAKSFRLPLGVKPNRTEADSTIKTGKGETKATEKAGKGAGGGKPAPAKPAKPFATAKFLPVLAPQLLPFPPTTPFRSTVVGRKKRGGGKEAAAQQAPSSSSAQLSTAKVQAAKSGKGKGEPAAKPSARPQTLMFDLRVVRGD